MVYVFAFSLMLTFIGIVHIKIGIGRHKIMLISCVLTLTCLRVKLLVYMTFHGWQNINMYFSLEQFL